LAHGVLEAEPFIRGPPKKKKKPQTHFLGARKEEKRDREYRKGGPVFTSLLRD